MDGTRLLARCAVLLALGGCTSERFGAEPPRAFLTERIDRTAKKTIDTPSASAKASNQRITNEPAPIILPSWKIAATAKPGTASNPAMPPTILFDKVSPSVYGVRVAHEANREIAVSYGSAVAITSQEAITNCHVVSQGKVIVLSNGATALPAEVSYEDGRSYRCYLMLIT
jgi:S1-C subfamily serine protease